MKKLIPLAEWARREGVPLSTARLRVQQGEIPGRRIGRYWFVESWEEGGPGRGHVLTVFNYAGGVGKTSLVRDLGFALVQRGYRVLLIDTDPQASLTAWLGIGEVEDRHTLATLEKGPLPEPLEAHGMYVIPSNLNLALLEVRIRSLPGGELLLRNELQGLREVYDFILVDSPPSLGPLAFLAGLAGDGFIVPVEVSPKGLKGLSSVIDISRTYARVVRQEHFIRLLVPTRYDPRSRVAQQALSELKEKSPYPVAPPVHQRPGSHQRATDLGVPIQLVEEAQEAAGDVEGVVQALLKAVNEEVMAR